MSKRNLVFIEVLRVFSLIGVIVFHILGMLESKLPEISKTHSLALCMKGSVYYVDLAVSMFMFISGYLYKKPAGKSEIFLFVKRKLLRLWLPYCFVTVLIMLTSGFFNWECLVKGDFWHLWFLTALFWCFIISIAIDYSSKWTLWLLPISLILSLVKFPPFLGLSDFIQWFYFFVLGAIIKQYPIFIVWMRRHFLWVLCIAFYIIIKLYIPFSYRNPSVLHYLANSVIILSIWSLLSKCQFRQCGKIFVSIGECSMGIYVLHYWFLIYILSNTSFSIFHIPAFVASHTLATICLIILVTFVISYIVTKLLRMCKWGRLLVG